MPLKKEAPDSLIQLAHDTALNAVPRTMSFQWEGKKLWVKRATDHKAKFWHKIQKGLAFLIPLPILRPTVSSGGAEGLKTENRRITLFRDAGFIVPDVFALSDDWIVLEDIGLTVELVLKRDKTLTAERLTSLVTSSAQTLARLHQAGFAHGRGSLDDMTFTNEKKIGFIDLEEDIENANIPLTALQARDLFLFSVSVARFTSIKPDIVKVALHAYTDMHPDPLVVAEVKKLLCLLKPFHALLTPFHKRLKREPRRVYDAVSALTISV